MEFLCLPVVMVERVLSCLSYDEIAKNRLVSKDFDVICQRLLNRGFMMIERKISASLKAVKSQLPRRESERRYHPFSKHCDILTSVETRISMLSMTYTKFIDHGTCCFIPGKVVDEIEKVLQIVVTSPSLPRAHEVLQELRDISSMAIEHFDDKVSPALRKKLHEGAAAAAVSANASVCSSGTPEGVSGLLGEGTSVASDIQSALHTEFSVIKQRCWLNHRTSVQLSVRCYKLTKELMTYKRMADTQARQLKEVALWKADHDQNMAELKRRIEECDMKYSELTHQAVAKAIITEPTEQVMPSRHQPLKNFASQIKLDLSVLPIGSAKGKSPGSNIRPRTTFSTSPTADRIEYSLPNMEQPPPVDVNQESAAAGSRVKTSNAKAKPLSRVTKRSISECSISAHRDWLTADDVRRYIDAKKPKIHQSTDLANTENRQA